MNEISLYYYNHNAKVKPRHITKNIIPYYDLTIVLKGALYYVYYGESVVLKPGDFILIRPGEYRQRLDSEILSEYISFNFSCDMDLTSIPSLSINALGDEMNLLLTACDSFFNTENYLKKISYILGALLLYIRDNVTDSQMNPLALRIKNYILKNYAERITLKSISEEVHFSVSYCNSVFKKGTRKPIVEYLIEMRMQKAKELLKHTNFTLPEIASKVGYDDYNYFSRLFKKNTHYSPTQYRLRHSEK